MCNHHSFTEYQKEGTKLPEGRKRAKTKEAAPSSEWFKSFLKGLTAEERAEIGLAAPTSTSSESGSSASHLLSEVAVPAPIPAPALATAQAVAPTQDPAPAQAPAQALALAPAPAPVQPKDSEGRLNLTTITDTTTHHAQSLGHEDDDDEPLIIKGCPPQLTPTGDKKGEGALKAAAATITPAPTTSAAAAPDRIAVTFTSYIIMSSSYDPSSDLTQLGDKDAKAKEAKTKPLGLPLSPDDVFNMTTPSDSDVSDFDERGRLKHDRRSVGFGKAKYEYLSPTFINHSTNQSINQSRHITLCFAEKPSPEMTTKAEPTKDKRYDSSSVSQPLSNPVLTVTLLTLDEAKTIKAWLSSDNESPVTGFNNNVVLTFGTIMTISSLLNTDIPVDVSALRDTGGSVSLIGRAIPSGTLQKKDVRVLDRSFCLNVANGSSMTIETYWTGKIQFGHAVVECKLYLAPEYYGQILIGDDLIEEFGISILRKKDRKIYDFTRIGTKYTLNTLSSEGVWSGEVNVIETSDRGATRTPSDTSPPEIGRQGVHDSPTPNIGPIWIRDMTRVWHEALSKFPVLITPEGKGPIVQHEARIPVTPGPPVMVAPYRSALKEREFVQKKMKELLAKGTIRKCTSDWNSPILVVPKAGDEKFRLVVDYRKLHLRIRGDTYPLPHVEDLLTKTAGAHLARSTWFPVFTRYPSIKMISNTWRLPHLMTSILIISCPLDSTLLRLCSLAS